MVSLPLPRLVSQLPIYEGGERPRVEIQIAGRRGKRSKMVHTEGTVLSRQRGGGAVALWAVPGLPGEHRSRRAAMRARMKALRSG